MSFYPEFFPQNIIGVDVFLERFQTRMYVGKLEKAKGQFHFSYGPSYLKMKNIISLGPEFPLTQQDFYSPELFPSFADRLPDPENPAYADYCAAAGIAVTTTDPIVLLSTIGKRGPSSFIFEPIYKDSFNFDDCEKFREKLGLSMQDFALLFEISLSILQKIKAGGTSGKEILKRLEIFMKYPEILHRQIKKNMKWLHPNKQRELMFNLLKENLSLLDTQSFSFEKAGDLIDQAIDCYMYISYKDEPRIEKEIKTFNTEIKPIFKIAEYLKLLGCVPQRITFCSKNEALGYDGVFRWPDQEVKLEVTRAIDEEDGKNEHLSKEDAKRRPIIAPDFNYREHGIKHRSQLSNNLPTQTLYTNPTVQNFQDIIQHLKKAFDNKNSKEKYKGMWLIMTLKLPQNLVDYFEYYQNSFHEICYEFWKGIDIKQCVLSRVFIISENFVNCTIQTFSPDFPDKLYTKRRKPQTAIWDSGLISI